MRNDEFQLSCYSTSVLSSDNFVLNLQRESQRMIIRISFDLLKVFFCAGILLPIGVSLSHIFLFCPGGFVKY